MLFTTIIYITITSLLIMNSLIYYNINDNFNLLLIIDYIIIYITILILVLIYLYIEKYKKQEQYNKNIIDSSQDTENLQNTANCHQIIKFKCKPVLKISNVDIYNIYLEDNQPEIVSNDYTLSLDETYDDKIVFVLVYDMLYHPRIVLTQIKDIRHINLSIYKLNEALIDVISNVAYIDNYNVNNIIGKFNKNSVFVNFHNELKKFIKDSKDALIFVAQ